MKLAGQVAVIVGEAIACTFAGEGAKIILMGLERVKSELDGVVRAIPARPRR